jgi:hypothetical protein
MSTDVLDENDFIVEGSIVVARQAQDLFDDPDA